QLKPSGHTKVQITGFAGTYRSFKFKAFDQVAVKNVKLTFGIGDQFDLTFNKTFKAGEASRVMDLPAASRIVKFIEFFYEPPANGKPLAIEVSGERSNALFDKLPPQKWSDKGSFAPAQTLSEGKIPLKEKNINALQLTFHKTIVKVQKAWVQFANGDKLVLKILPKYGTGTVTRVFDMPRQHVATAVHVLAQTAANPRNQQALITIRGRQNRPKKSSTGPKAITKGWKLLGLKSVRVNSERDSIRVGFLRGKIGQLKVIAGVHPVFVDTVKITFNNKKTHTFKVNKEIPAGTESETCVFPGGPKIIQKIVFVYRSTGGKKSTLAMYGK
ncbi:MAG: hypothetical protein P1V97_15505, partial [Planctomycetota bacterium]|nr:hypothetical protein [Planctomycetota bacterium]